MNDKLAIYQQEIEAVKSLEELRSLEVRLLGKQGEVSGLMKDITKVPPEERKAFGQRVNALNEGVTQAVAKRREGLVGYLLMTEYMGYPLDKTSTQQFVWKVERLVIYSEAMTAELIMQFLASPMPAKEFLATLDPQVFVSAWYLDKAANWMRGLFHEGFDNPTPQHLSAAQCLIDYGE